MWYTVKNITGAKEIFRADFLRANLKMGYNKKKYTINKMIKNGE